MNYSLLNEKTSNILPGKGIQSFWDLLKVRIAEFVWSELAATNLLLYVSLSFKSPKLDQKKFFHMLCLLEFTGHFEFA